ncbi:hypothetical protein TNCV_554241 [Trichonephila clavipes]|nr:hypothetical protein TNCV_554241 [Trichonephila clavipes]
MVLKQFVFQVLKQLYVSLKWCQWFLPLSVFLMRTGVQSVLGKSSMDDTRLVRKPVNLTAPVPALPLTIPDDPEPEERMKFGLVCKTRQ